MMYFAIFPLRALFCNPNEATIDDPPAGIKDRLVMCARSPEIGGLEINLDSNNHGPCMMVSAASV